MIRPFLLSSTAALGLLASAPAQAACVEDLAGFTCNGLDATGVRDERPAVLGRLLPGARVTRDEAAGASLDAASVVVGDRATLLVSDGAEILDELGLGLVTAGDGLALVNDGVVGGRFLGTPGAGLAAGDDLRVVNGATGSIGAEGGAVRAGARASIVNEGRVSSLLATLALGDDSTILNATGAEIFGQEAIVVAGADLRLRNAGLLEGFNEGVLAGPRLDLENSGTIRSSTGVTGGAESRAVNRGTIAGERFGVTLGDESLLTNSGGQAFIGATERAVRLGNLSELYNSGRIQGGEIGLGFDDRVFVSNAFGGEIGADDVAIQGGGTLEIDNTGRIRSQGTGVDASWVFLNQDAGGTIETRGDAISADRINTFNYGTILSEEGDAIDVETGSIYTYRRLAAPNGAAVRLRATSDADGPSLVLSNERGVVEGQVAVEVARGRASASVFVAGGELRGTSGTAVRLASGDDRVSLTQASVLGDIDLGGGGDSIDVSLDTTIDGRVLLGAGDDRLTFRRSMFDEVAGSFGLFDGGSGLDTVSFSGFSLASLSLRATTGGFFFDLADGPSRLSGTFARFERYRFDDGTLALEDGVPAPVPLPAALPLLAAGLLGLGLVGRRRAG